MLEGFLHLFARRPYTQVLIDLLGAYADGELPPDTAAWWTIR